jgi:hypothetical protein
MDGEDEAELLDELVFTAQPTAHGGSFEYELPNEPTDGFARVIRGTSCIRIGSRRTQRHTPCSAQWHCVTYTFRPAVSANAKQGIFPRVEEINVFLSYASEDRSVAAQINAILSGGTLPISVWFDRQALLGGMNWKQEIREAIRKADVFILLLSRRSTSKKGYIQREIREALDLVELLPEGRVFVVPVRIDPCEPHFQFLSDLQWIDLFPDWERGIALLLATLEAQFTELSPRIAQVSRVRGLLLDAFSRMNLGPYVYTPSVVVSTPLDDPKRSLGLFGQLVSEAEQQEHLIEVAVMDDDIYRNRGVIASAAILLREARDIRRDQTTAQITCKLLSVVPTEVNDKAVTDFIDAAALGNKILATGYSGGVCLEANIDRKIWNSVWWQGKPPV